MMKPRFTLLYMTLLLMAGCSYFPTVDWNLVPSSYKAADALLKGVKKGIYMKQPILVASFVNIDNVQQSSTFGRMIAEQIGSRLVQRGYRVIELKMRTNNVFVQEKTGELLLSRQLQNISVQHDAYAVVVGTYGDGKEIVYVTAKLVRAQNNVILSSYDYSLPVGPVTKKMLSTGRR